MVREAGYGEGVNSLIPGTNPYAAAATAGVANRADPGAVYFHPGKCAAGPSFFGPWATSLSVATAAAACGGFTGFAQPTELSLTQARWLSYNVQFYLPLNFWISGGQKYIWYTNAQNATDATCTTDASGACVIYITPVNQGRSFLGPGMPAPGGVGLVGVGPPLFNLAPFISPAGTPNVNNASILYTGRDSVIKRQTYSYVAVFYDMTPNIRWGFEWGMHGTDRRDSFQDNQSHRWQFGAYYFF